MDKKPRAQYYLACAVGAVTFLVYLPALRNGFINWWDDKDYIIENTHIRSFDPALFKWAFFDFYAGNWHPLTWISHAADYAVWGLNPAGHHLTNIVLHSINTFLVAILAIRLVEAWEKQPGGRERATGRAKPIAAGVTGLLFGLHPIHVESVAWAAERKDVLSALFFLLSILAYLKYAAGLEKTAVGEDLQMDSRPYFLSLCLFALAILSKPMAVSLPLVLLILDWHPLGRTGPLKTLLAEKAPFFALSGLSAVLTIMAQKAGGALSTLQFAPLSVRALVAVKSLASYLFKMALPLDLVPFYPYPKEATFLSFEYFLPLVLITGITAACLLAAKRQRLYLACWVYYIVTLLPALGLVRVGSQSMADRYSYLPSLGPFLLAGLGIGWFWRQPTPLSRPGRQRPWAGAAGIVLLVFFMSYLTVRQIGVWKDSLIFWDYVIEKEPGKVYAAYNNRGQLFQEAGQPDRALADYNQAIAIDPFCADSYYIYNNRGNIFQEKGQFDRAISDYNRAIMINRSRELAYYNRGNAYNAAGRPDLAIADYDRAIALNPSYAEAYNNRGIVFLETGQPDKSLMDFNKSIMINPNQAGAYANRGQIYLHLRDKGHAISDFSRACGLGNQQSCNFLRSLGS